MPSSLLQGKITRMNKTHVYERCIYVVLFISDSSLRLLRFTGSTMEKYSNRATIKVFSYHMTGSCLSWIRKRPMDKMFLQCSSVETRTRIFSVVVMTKEIQEHSVCMMCNGQIFDQQHQTLISYCVSMVRQHLVNTL